MENHQNPLDRYQQGGDDNSVYRSRLVGKEFNNEAMEGTFAGTPPLEALRYIVHEAATIRRGETTDTKVIMINGVSRAFFEARAVRQVCVEIPEEDLVNYMDVSDANRGF